MRISDWSSDVCSSDLRPARARHAGIVRGKAGTVRGRNHGHPIRETHDASVAGTCRTAAVASLTLSDAGRHAPLKRRPLESCAVATKTRSEEHTSELQSLMSISYAVFCLNKTNKTNKPKPK